MSAERELLLASASPRRQELLRQIGVNFQLRNHQVEEIQQPGEAPRAFVSRMAREKALDVLSRTAADRPAVVLGADTAVVVDDEVLGKPRDAADGRRMLAMLSGRGHQVLSAVTLCDRDRCEEALSVTTVRFRPLDPEEILAYWQTGEPLDKAGAYAVQGYAAVFVEEIRGSFTGVVGLPLFETAALLGRFGLRCWQPHPDCPEVGQ
ncbi:MAG: hypothetical protein RLZZ385_1717 [Pseudomonadota bacterium]|jgi:septum formation protein